MSIDSVKIDLIRNFEESQEYRQAYVEESVYARLCFQISTIREQRGLSQKELGRIVGMAQERISILEDPNADTKPTLNTLLRIAAGYDCGLDVRFIPFNKVIDNSFDNGPEALRVDSFENIDFSDYDPERTGETLNVASLDARAVDKESITASEMRKGAARELATGQCANPNLVQGALAS